MGIIYKTNSLAIWQSELYTNETLDTLAVRAMLNQDEITKLTSINGSQRKALWVGARVMVKEMFDGKIAYLDSGKPILVDKDSHASKTHISISHTHDLVVLAFGEKPLGVDIENLERDASRAVRKFATHGELNLAQEHFPQNPHLWVWCAKEALYKAHGVEGIELKTDISLESISSDGKIKCRVKDTKYFCDFQIIENYLIALAIKIN